MDHRSSVLFSVVALASSACTVGEVDRYEARRDLAGLELAKLQSAAPDAASVTKEQLGGEVFGSPAWFLPVLGFDVAVQEAQYRGPVAEDRAPLTGFAQSEFSGVGLGIVGFASKESVWDTGGKLQTWEDEDNLLLGLLWHQRVWGKGEKRVGWDRRLLAGSFGYLEQDDRGYLVFLWIPIPVRL